jgi:hypothetical protein
VEVAGAERLGEMETGWQVVDNGLITSMAVKKEKRRKKRQKKMAHMSYFEDKRTGGLFTLCLFSEAYVRLVYIVRLCLSFQGVTGTAPITRCVAAERSPSMNA